MKSTNYKRQNFVEEYLRDFNATQAAIRAGYSKRSANHAGSRLLTMPDIQEALAKRAKDLIDEAGISPEQVIRELALIAFTDLRDFIRWTDEGVQFIPSDDLPPHKARAVAEVTADITVSVDGEGNPVRKAKVGLKTWNKVQALDKLGQYFKLFVERREVVERIELQHRVVHTLADALDAAYGHSNGHSVTSGG